MAKDFHINLYFDTVKDSLRDMSAWQVRKDAVKQFAWAIPNEETIKALVPYCTNGLVEICAGSGYWARCFRSLGVDVLALDRKPWADQWSPVRKGKDVDAGKHPERALFLCWPPYDDPAAAKALSAYTKAGGERLIFVGEGYYGCTANNAFFKYLDKFYTEVDWFSIPQWNGIHDSVRVYDRKQIERVK